MTTYLGEGMGISRACIEGICGGCGKIKWWRLKEENIDTVQEEGVGRNKTVGKCSGIM